MKQMPAPDMTDDFGRILLNRITFFVNEELLRDEEPIAVVTALLECAGALLGLSKPSTATAEGNHLFALLCDHFACAIAHYAAGGAFDRTHTWDCGENDDETRFRA